MAYVGNPVDVLKKLHSNNQWDDIVLFCQKMLVSDPNDLMALQNLAMAFLQLGQYEKVISLCDQVLELNEFDDYALKNKILALEKLQKYDVVIELCNKSLSTNPLNPWVLNTKGLAYNELGQHEVAIQYYEMSLKIDPTNTTALLNNANTLAFLGRPADAIPYYDLAQQQENSKFISMAKSEAYQKLGKSDEAFLAAQGLLVSEIDKYLREAHSKKLRIFDYYCMVEYEILEKRKTDKQNFFHS
ncbi:MAG TPA: tetratricopeptide repeat protein [Candidatus Nitrosotenuis sp.]|jgi:tetratricopeptide (TPR) repeat protein|nr:tetratricopeptide repeat protein [Candidatus Nitrosotenuis sp.]